MANNISTWAISFGKVIISTLIDWFTQIYDSLGMTNIWLGAVTVSIVFSIFLIPLRGGADLSRGSFGGFLKNKVNKAKSSTGSNGGNGGN